MNEPILDVDDIQGVSFPGFRKSNHHFLFFSIVDPSAARDSLFALRPRISSARQTLDSHDAWKVARSDSSTYPEPLFLSLSLSATGLRLLIDEAEVDQFKDKPFKIGMAKRSILLGDPGNPADDGHSANWVIGGEKQVDVLVSLASDAREMIEEALEPLLETLIGLSLVYHDKGAHMPEAPGHEHFGFADGVSQPALRGHRSDRPDEHATPRRWPADAAFDELRKDFASPGRPLIWPGHIFFGYNRQTPLDPRIESETDAPKGPAWAKNGSFLVYRRLRQHVDRFEAYLENTAQTLGIEKDRLGALLVGRWKDGTPISRSPGGPLEMGRDVDNYFGFTDAVLPRLPDDPYPMAAPDLNGRICPFGAHIRKVNPRDEATDLGAAAKTPPKLILRRGITFDEGDDDKGLIFVGFMSSIRGQFEFLMTDWINGDAQPRVGAGHDPLLANGDNRYVNLWLDGTLHRLPLPGDFVIPTGGEYFFTPPCSFLARHFGGGARA